MTFQSNENDDESARWQELKKRLAPPGSSPQHLPAPVRARRWGFLVTLLLVVAVAVVAILVLLARG
jgi:ferric-dicitrate binding protein FerR (iron transport regulator)